MVTIMHLREEEYAEASPFILCITTLYQLTRSVVISMELIEMDGTLQDPELWPSSHKATANYTCSADIANVCHSQLRHQ